MRHKIGIFGSAVNASKDKTVEMAKALGKSLSKQNVTLITGACSGLPYITAYTFAKAGLDVFGYSPEYDIRGQKLFTPRDDISIYKQLIFIPKSFKFNSQIRKKYRNVISTAHCDAGIIISGRWGTMNEFTNLYDMGKVIGILTGSGGIADEISTLVKMIHKKSKAIILFNNNPQKLIQLLLEELEKRAI